MHARDFILHIQEPIIIAKPHIQSQPNWLNLL